MKRRCPRCGGEAEPSSWSARTWCCDPCDLEWDWTVLSGILGYWSRRGAVAELHGVSDVMRVVEVPSGTLPVFAEVRG